MNLLQELANMLAPQPIPEGAITAASLAKELKITHKSAKNQLDQLAQKGVLTARIIRTTNSGGCTCDMTIYEKPTPTPQKSTTSPERPGS